jgi:hypothetical protein
MPLLDSALAFAVTMLALSLACSAFVELIHRIFKMRQAGFEYMLGQMFDQVLSKYVESGLKAAAAVAAKDTAYLAKVEEKNLKDPFTDASAIARLKAEAKKLTESYDVTGELKKAKDAFVERMRANRAPMRAGPYADLTGSSTVVPENSRGLRVWGGRELTELSPVGFMERLGTMEVGTMVASAANNLDAALKDIAQKFEALGTDAADYFEGRARLISVTVAVVFAFAVHADAVDLYTTYLQNPNATAAVIAKSNAITAQAKAAQESDDAKKPTQDSQKADGKIQPAEMQKAPQQADVKKPPEDVQKAATQHDGKKPPEDAKKAATHAGAKKQPDDAQKAAMQADAKKQPEDAQKAVTQDDGKKQVQDVQKVAESAKTGMEKTVKQFADVGVPLGWSDERYKAANMSIWAWTCKELPPGQKPEHGTFRQQCKADDAAYLGLKDQQYMNILFEVPTKLSVLFYLLLGGLLIGLGAPFWFNVVTTITNIRGAGGAGRAGEAIGSAPQARSLLALGASPEAAKAQPATPVGAFQVAQAAKKE